MPDKFLNIIKWLAFDREQYFGVKVNKTTAKRPFHEKWAIPYMLSTTRHWLPNQSMRHTEPYNLTLKVTV
jgi:hypothetical protein